MLFTAFKSHIKNSQAVTSSTNSSLAISGPPTNHSDASTSCTTHLNVAIATQTHVSKKLKMLEEMEIHPSSSRSSPPGSDVARSQLLQEINSYLGPLRLSDAEKLSPLIFWKQNSHLYPCLSLLAKTYLTPSASSVPVESMFSTTGLIKTHGELQFHRSAWIKSALYTTIMLNFFPPNDDVLWCLELWKPVPLCATD